MKQGIKYAVFVDQKEFAIGYFLDNTYYEPFVGRDHPFGHLEPNGDFVSYLVTPTNPNIRISGKLEGDFLIRNRDGHRLQVQPA